MSAGPVREGERAEILDILRGFALLGIFVAHVPGFSGWDHLSASQQAILDPGSDGVLQFLRDVFVRGKFYTLFSLLFGVGFAIQRASAGRMRVEFAARFRRRQLGLLGFGALHSALWHGDILLTYALLGLLLIPFADASPRRVLTWALSALALRGLWGVLTFGFAGATASIGNSAVGDGAGGVDVMGSVRAITAGYARPDWGEMLAANAHFLGMKWLLVLYDGRLFSIAGCFLLGVALGKWRVHERVSKLGRELSKVVAIAGPIGLLGNIALALLWSRVPTYPPTAAGVLTNLLYAVAVPALSIAMAAALALAWVRDFGRPILGAFAPVGRMALTIYLMQTAIGIAAFYGVGFGYRGTISLTLAVALAVAVFGLQGFLARGWLHFFQFGPFEWIWRCATYGRVLSIRRPARACGQPSVQHP